MAEPAARTVLLVTRNFPPLVGGMEKLNLRMLEGLSKTHHTVLIGPVGSAAHAPAGCMIFQSPVSAVPVFLGYAALMSFYVALRFRPEVSLAGSGLTAPFAWLCARLSGARAVVYVHGLDLIADSRIYRALWLPFIRRCDAVLANSGNTRRLAESAGVSPERITVVHPGTDIPEMDTAKIDGFRARFGFDDSPLLLSVGRITERKGLLPFLCNAWPAVLEKYPDAKLAVIGTEPQQALRKDKRGILADIRAYLSEAGLDASVRFLGRVDDPTLTAAYQAADVHVFPVLDSPDDVEGFGMVAIEAAANGLPTVAFDAGGVADAVIQGETGVLVPPGDYGRLADVLLKCISTTNAETRMLCRTASCRYSWDEFNRNIAKAIS